MCNTREKHFEDEFVNHFVENGYKLLQNTSYNKKIGLIKDSLERFIENTQPEIYENIQEDIDFVFRTISNEIQRTSVINILRNGVEIFGHKIKLFYSKPVDNRNQQQLINYTKNEFSIVRQLFYNNNNESIDVVIFINGIPIITFELKNPLSGQNIEHAVEQYKNRNKHDLIFQFKRCIAHFAVDPSNLKVTTKIDENNTFFLPFNKYFDENGPETGYKISFLWNEILTIDGLADILQNYVQLKEESKLEEENGELVTKTTTTLIFPRYHQIRAVKNIIRRINEVGPTEHFLIYHSAGSGKSNTISWLAYQLDKLKLKDSKMFNSIIVVTDRIVLDKQIQKNIEQFEYTNGVVESINSSRALKHAIETNKHIIVTTIQKFPHIVDDIKINRNKRYAIIIDEAHSSQAGEYQNKMRQSLEDIVTTEVEKKSVKNVIYVAFTATPKNKTLELFGHNGKPFDTYSMKQAIKEGFILDVLQNYMFYKTYCEAGKNTEESIEVIRGKARKQIIKKIINAAIPQKAEIIVNHFNEKVKHTIYGEGRAMVVCNSRQDAVDYFLEISKLVENLKLDWKPLVAYTGTINVNGREQTEQDLNGNEVLNIPAAFKLKKYRILIVADKYQTGFDEPNLQTMYVDKTLRGVNAVQTLSRLNRVKKGKKSVFVLDFANNPSAIKESFEKYYEDIELAEPSSLENLDELYNIILNYNIIQNEKIQYINDLLNNGSHELINSVIQHIVNTWNNETDDTKVLFRRNSIKFVRAYRYMLQLYNLDEKYSLLYNVLNLTLRLLQFETNSNSINVEEYVDINDINIQKEHEESLSIDNGNGEFIIENQTISRQLRQENTETLMSVINRINNEFGTDLEKDYGITEKDQTLFIEDVEKIQQTDKFKSIINANNTKNQKINQLKQMYEDELINRGATDNDDDFNYYNKMTTKLPNDKEIWIELFAKFMTYGFINIQQILNKDA